MVEIKTEWNKENLKKYIVYKTFFANKYTMLSFIVFFVCFLAIVATCIAMFCMIRMPIFLVMAGIVALFSAAFAVFFTVKINKNVKQSLKESTEGAGENEQETAILTEELITVFKNGLPYGGMEWDKISSISFNDKGGAVYLSTEEGAVLILEYKNIIRGTEAELKEMLQIKNVKLSNKA